MEEIIEFIREKWDVISWYDHIIILLFLITLIFITLKMKIIKIYKVLKNFIEFFKLPKEKNQIYHDVVNHNLMKEIKLIKSNLQLLNFGDKERNKIFSFILNTQMDYTKKYALEIVNTYNINELDEKRFTILMSEMWTNIISDTNIKLNLELGNDIYNVVITDPVKGIKNWTKNMNKQTWSTIDEFCSNDYLKTNHAKFLFILTTMSTSLTIIFNGIEERFNGFNGELTELLNNRRKNKYF